MHWHCQMVVAPGWGSASPRVPSCPDRCGVFWYALDSSSVVIVYLLSRAVLSQEWFDWQESNQVFDRQTTRISHVTVATVAL